MPFTPTPGGSDLSGFYRRLEEIRAIWDTDRKTAEAQLAELMRDYPGMIEDLQTNQEAGRKMFMDAGMPEARLAGSPSNPFSYHVGASFLEHAGQGLQKYLGGKMMLQSKADIEKLRGQQDKVRGDMGRAFMPGGNQIAGVSGPNAYGVGDVGFLQDQHGQMAAQKTLAQMLREEEKRRRRDSVQAFYGGW